MNVRLLLAPVALCVTFASAARAQSGATRFVAPTDQTVTTHLEEGSGSFPMQSIWVENASTVAIQVYSVTLRDCQNVRQSCTPTPLKLRVRPGGRELLRRVEPRDVEQSFGFRYSIGWRADSSDLAALRLLADNGVARAQEQLAANAADAADRRATVGRSDAWLGPEELATLAPQIARLRVEPESVVVHPGQLIPMRQVRVMAVDAQGALLGRVSAYRWRVQSGAVSVKADTVVAEHVGRSSVEFLLGEPAAALAVRMPIVVVADSAR